MNHFRYLCTRFHNSDAIETEQQFTEQFGDVREAFQRGNVSKVRSRAGLLAHSRRRYGDSSGRCVSPACQKDRDSVAGGANYVRTGTVLRYPVHTSLRKGSRAIGLNRLAGCFLFATIREVTR